MKLIIGKIIVDIEDLRLMAKEDYIPLNKNDFLKYNLKMIFQNSSGEVSFDKKEERDEIFNKIESFLVEKGLGWKRKTEDLPEL